jgi:hypothetical protein
MWKGRGEPGDAAGPQPQERLDALSQLGSAVEE